MFRSLEKISLQQLKVNLTHVNVLWINNEINTFINKESILNKTNYQTT